MNTAQDSASSAGRIRRWRVPPPLTRSGELLEGAEILNEIPGETAVLLWKSLRSVTLWAAAAPREQAELFSPGARERREAEVLAVDPEPALVEPLRVFAELLGTPAAMRREVVALACRQVAQWADARGARETALSFVQAAAVACPGDADLAYEVGRRARRQVQTARAESWYRRAVMLGRQAGDWTSYSRAYLGLGNLAMQRGSLPNARRAFIKALRASRRHGLHPIQALAHHDLFIASMQTESTTGALRHASGAFHLYGPRHANVPNLAHDVCVLWIRDGEFTRAQRVLTVLVPRLEDGVQMLGHANLARACAGAGDRDGFQAAWRAAQALVERLGRTRWTAQSLLNLARGATALGEWEMATEAATRAVRFATECGENNIVFEAESVLANVASHQRALATPASEPAQGWSEEADALEGELVDALTGAA